MQQVTAEDNTTSIFRVRSTLLFFYYVFSPLWQHDPFTRSISFTESSAAYLRKIKLNVHKQKAVRAHSGMEVKLHSGAQDWEGMVPPPQKKQFESLCS